MAFTLTASNVVVSLSPSPATPSPPEDLRVVPTAMPLQYNIVWNRPADQPECVSIIYFITVKNIETNRTLLEVSYPSSYLGHTHCPTHTTERKYH